MSAWDKRLSLFGFCIIGLSMLGLSGCGGFGAKPVPVSGAVTLNNLPLPFALVVYHPEELGGKTVAAVTDIRGRYFLKDGENLGVPPGAYRVTIRYFTGVGGLTERPEPQANFSGNNLTQLIAANYSDPGQTELNVIVLDEEADKPNSFIHVLQGDDVPLPPGAEQRPVVPGEQKPVKPSVEVLPTAVTSSSTFSLENLVVYGGGFLLFLGVAGGAWFFLNKRSGAASEVTGSDYHYDGEMDDDEDLMNSIDTPVTAPRRKKKRKKKKVRKKSKNKDDGPAAPIPEEDSAEADEVPDDSEGSPFPVLDEGMDDDDLAAAFLAGDEETIPAPKPAGTEASAAQSILAAGGFVKIQSGDDAPVNVKKTDDLPQDKFHVLGVFFEGVEDFDDEQLKKIKKLPHLDTLDLASTGISDAGLKSLSQLPSIRTLALSRTTISDAGLKHLTALPDLRVLLLYRTKVTDACVDQLKKLSKLKTVELKRTEVTEAGAKELQEALPKCKVII